MRILAILSVLLAVPALAQSLPLQGYYRPGEYMPVALSAERETRISAPQCVPTIVAPAAYTQIVPLLTLSDSASELKVGDQTFSLRPLKPSQRLIGLVDVNAADIATLFADKDVVPVALAREDLKSAIPISFDSLDALVCSADSFRALDTITVDVLRDSGVAIVVRSSSPPDARRGWESADAYQVLRSAPGSGTNAIPREEVYKPIHSWRPQRSEHARWLIVTVAAFAAIVVLALSLLPRRWGLVTIITFCAIASIVIWMTARRTSARTWIVAGETQRDSQREVWHYFASADTQHFQEPLPVPGYPIPFSLQHAADLNLQLHVNGANVSLSFDLDSTRRLCLVTKGDWKHDDAIPTDISMSPAAR